jgi:ubiquitin carboxyl-terminal hydrolase 36/42
VIDQIFGMKLLSTIKCLSCSNITEKEDVSRVLMLEVNNLFSLMEAFQHFFSSEILTNSDAYHCSKCNKLVNAQKALTIHEPSPILIVCFKRSISNGKRTRKLMHQIDYDELLDVSPYLNCQSFDNSSSNHSNKGVHQFFYYKLYCVITHSGVNAETGHFIAYLRTSQDAWFRIDDGHFQEVSLTEVINNQSAFILFYAKASKSSTNTHVLSNQQKPYPALSQNNLVLRSISFSDVPVDKSNPQLQISLSSFF